jgi:hypothetical protein
MPSDKFKIGYIDDNPTQVRSFQRDAGQEFDVVKIPLKKSLDTVVSDIFDQKINAVVIDYDLREGNNKINYQGDDIFKKVIERVDNFPAFILTSHVNEAEKQAIDINAIYDRDAGNFLKRVRRQIENYQKNLELVESEFSKLKSKKKRNLVQEERMIELDTLIERSLDKRSELPKTLKKTSDLKKINELIQETDKLIKEIKKHEKPKKSA